MSSKRVLKLLHFSGTAWFVLCVAFLLILAMRQAGASWWLIFSLSGYSIVFIFLFTSFYLFALYRGVVRTKEQNEHPLTTSVYYMGFYDISPFLGAVAGLLSSVGSNDILQLLVIIATGSLSTTFIIWIIADPIAGMIESVLPASREARHKRLEEIKANKLAEQEFRDRILAELAQKQKLCHEKWNETLVPIADSIIELITSSKGEAKDTRQEIIKFGAEAWKIDGIESMKYLHKLVKEKIGKILGTDYVDFVAFWWDGIGTWRRPESI